MSTHVLFIYVSMYESMYVCMYSMYVCMYVCMYICMCVGVYVNLDFPAIRSKSSSCPFSSGLAQVCTIAAT
jgi:hypothetical protein